MPIAPIALVALLALVHLGRALLDPYENDSLLELFAFQPARLGDGIAIDGDAAAAVSGLFTHVLLHSDGPHLFINAIWLLVVGVPVARRMSATAFLAYTALCGAGGAVTYMALQPGAETGVIGASGAISGVMAAAFRLVFATDDVRGRNLLRADPLNAPRLSTIALLGHPMGGLAVGTWLSINLVAAITGQYIAWEAHLGGFLTGLVAFDLFDRGRLKRPVFVANV